MTTRDDTARRRPRTAGQVAMLARLRDKGLGLAPVVRGGSRPSINLPVARAAAGVPVAVLSLQGPITRPTGARPAEGHTAPQALLPDRDGLRLAVEFEIDLSLLPEWQAARISANDRHGHMQRAKRTKLWRKAGKLAAAGCEPLPWGRVVMFYRFPDNRRRESSNLQPTSKAILDGMVDAGLLADDRDELVDGPDNRRAWPNGSHRVVVQVWTPS